MQLSVSREQTSFLSVILRQVTNRFLFRHIFTNSTGFSAEVDFKVLPVVVCVLLYITFICSFICVLLSVTQIIFGKTKYKFKPNYRLLVLWNYKMLVQLQCFCPILYH